MIGSVGLEGLKITCIVGIHPHERVQQQDLFIDISCQTDFAAAAASEKVDDAVDYSAMAEELNRLAQERQYQLIETFAEEAAARMFELHPSILALELTIRKPAAVPAASCSFVRVQRSRDRS